MGITVHDTLYYPMAITKSYVNIDPTLVIKNKGNMIYDVVAHYCCYKHKDDDMPFHKVEITLRDVKDLNNMYKRLYMLVKDDFIKTSDVIDV